MPTEIPVSETTTATDPKELFAGKNLLPTRVHTFTRPDGQKVPVTLQGLPYGQKSILDALRRMARVEEERTGEPKADLHGPRLIAKAMRNTDGSRAYPREEDEIMAAIRFADTFSDGEINKAAAVVLELSGWSEDAEADAVKG